MTLPLPYFTTTILFSEEFWTEAYLSIFRTLVSRHSRPLLQTPAVGIQTCRRPAEGAGGCPGTALGPTGVGELLEGRVKDEQ